MLRTQHLISHLNIYNRDIHCYSFTFYRRGSLGSEGQCQGHTANEGTEPGVWIHSRWEPRGTFLLLSFPLHQPWEETVSCRGLGTGLRIQKGNSVMNTWDSAFWSNPLLSCSPFNNFLNLSKLWFLFLDDRIWIIVIVPTLEGHCKAWMRWRVKHLAKSLHSISTLCRRKRRQV